MKNLYPLLTIVLLFQLSKSAIAQVPAYSIVLSNQSQVDSFPINYPGYDTIDYNIVISGTDIMNLNALIQVKAINRGLFIYDCENLTSLAGLDSLASLGNALYITGWGDGFQYLNWGASSIVIKNNPLLVDLSGLGNVSMVDGSVNISSNENLTSLSGFDDLHVINGLRIQDNTSLPSLAGLESLDSIKGELIIDSNNSLINLQGLNNLAYVNYYTGENVADEGDSVYETFGFEITNNPMLSSLSGLDNLESTDGCFILQGNLALENLEGLEKLKATGLCTKYVGGQPFQQGGGFPVISYGGFIIKENDTLNSLEGLDSLQTVAYQLRIEKNNSLISLAGLDRLERINWKLQIIENDALTSLEGIESLRRVYDVEIEKNSSLASLTGIDSLKRIDGTLMIEENDILSSLEGLNSLDTISGDLVISNNNNLTSLSALENLSEIGGRIVSWPSFESWPYSINSPGTLPTICDTLSYGITVGDDIDDSYAILGNIIISGNSSLMDINGFSNIDTIRGGILIHDNDSLTNFDGFQNLKYLRGHSLVISDNQSLFDINGLDITDAAFCRLTIENNLNLSVCQISPVCNHIAKDSLYTSISGNAMGCSDENEVEITCMPTSVENMNNESIDIFPNPTKGYLQINGREIINWKYNVFDVTGKLQLSNQLSQENKIDVSGLVDGLYFLKLNSNYGHIFIMKFVKE